MSKLLIVGEAFGENEARLDFPFVGRAGAELYRMLSEADFPLTPISYLHPGFLKMKALWLESGIALTNVFMTRPKNNRVEEFLTPKGPEARTDLPPVKPGLYLHKDHSHHLEILQAKIEEVKPNLILACGNTACWALLHTTKISALRGTIAETPFGKVLPVYHPAAVSRNYEFRPITVADLFKAKRESETPDLFRKRREIWVEPSIADLWRWWDVYGSKSTLLSVDIETERYSQISEVGLASDSTHAIHIPFIIERTKSYWPTISEECKAWEFVHHTMASTVPKVGQNFSYDFQYFWEKVGIPVRNWVHDTMLLHHALYPGMQKGLGFLGSIYTDEPAWKNLRREGNKSDE